MVIFFGHLVPWTYGLEPRVCELAKELCYTLRFLSSHSFIFLDAIESTDPQSKSGKLMAHGPCLVCTLGNEEFDTSIQIVDFS